MQKISFTVVFLIWGVCAYCQTGIDNSAERKDRIVFRNEKAVQDTFLANYPLLTSVAEKVTLNEMPAAQKSVKGNPVSFHPVPGKGAIFIKIDQLPEDYFPLLEFYNSNGSMIKQIYVKSKISTINMERVPPGKYTVAIDFDEERYSLEIVKE